MILARRRTGQRGFGLIEILLVLVVVASAGFLLVRYLGSTARTVEMIQEERPIAHARLSADQATLVSVQAMVRAHHAQNGQWPADKAAVLTLLQSPPRFQCAGIDFGAAREFGGRCHLRFDDTNPAKESQEYVDAIMRDVRWLGFDWGEHLYHASDYFEQLYEWAVQLIKMGKAYVDDLTADQMSEYRGTLTESGRESPYRNRSVAENLGLFERMRHGEFEDGSKTLRAKIDMSSGNINLRDPVMYRIRKATHQRTGDTWCIYPMYDWAHGQSDSIEGVTHSICTLEYEDHRPLYDWYLDALGIFHPQQIEFARLNLSHTVMSKRKLLQLVEGGFVSGWDDPRM